MPTDIRAPLRGLQLEALRACALYPQGMRYGAHPSVITSRGHTVEPDDDFENWRVDGGGWLTAGAGHLPGPERRDSAAAVAIPVERNGARPRRGTRARILAVLTLEPATAVQIAERAGIPGRERGREAALVLVRL